MTDLETSPAAWRPADLECDRGWIYRLEESAARHLAAAVRAAYAPERQLFDYRREDIDLGPAAGEIARAFDEAKRGRGLALLRGLPRAGLSEEEFQLMNWAIGLHFGVARPQGRASQYISAVRDVGTDYRGASGRGYSSNAKLDFHVDDADLVTLSCYNKAKAGGLSMVSSGYTAYLTLRAEHPELLEVAERPFAFSRQGEEAPDERTFCEQPLFGWAEGRLFCKCNRNRIETAQRLTEVPPLTEEQRRTADVLDGILKRPELMFSMDLEPGDLQIMNNHVAAHSRSGYQDDDDPRRKRLLYRLWLAPPDSLRLPDGWREVYRCIEPGSVRGGFRGQRYDDACETFERRQAASLAMQMS